MSTWVLFSRALRRKVFTWRWIYFIFKIKINPCLSLTDTDEDSKLVQRRKRPNVDTLFSSLFFDASERRVWVSTESEILASTFGLFRMYRLTSLLRLVLGLFKLIPGIYSNIKDGVLIENNELLNISIISFHTQLFAFLFPRTLRPNKGHCIRFLIDFYSTKDCAWGSKREIAQLFNPNLVVKAVIGSSVITVCFNDAARS